MPLHPACAADVFSHSQPVFGASHARPQRKNECGFAIAIFSALPVSDTPHGLRLWAVRCALGAPLEGNKKPGGAGPGKQAGSVYRERDHPLGSSKATAR